MPSADNREQREEEDHVDTEPKRVLHDCGREGTPHLRILHFNDVYHPQPSEEEPKGGAARLKSLCDHYRNNNEFSDAPYPLTLFSGDAFNPSKESTVTKGRHMVPVLNEIGIDLACVGNHEFDFGAAHFAYLAKDCDFPWLLANMYDPELGESQPMGRCQRTKMLTTSSGLKVGVIGLVEEEWTKKINNSLPADLQYHDMKDVAKELGPKLREQGAEIVVVLSHARQERDFDFCGNLPAGTVDLVLGGHDHWGEHQEFDNGVHFVRSGYDFKNLSYITGFKSESGKGWDFTVVRRNLNSDIDEDENLKKLQKETVENIEKQLQNEIGSTAVPLEARKEKAQTEETNYGNFLADLMRLHQHADCALINGGTFAADFIYPSGLLKLKDIVDCFPFEDPIVVMKVTGKAIWDALENGVSKYPEQDSCFPHVSNIRFRFDPDAPVGQRVLDVSLGDEDLKMDKEYTMATRSHLAAGKCGYESIRGRTDGGTAIEIVDDENGILVSTLLRQHFSAVQMGNVFKHITNKHHNHWDGVLGKLDKSKSGLGDDDRKQMLAKRALLRWRRLAGHEVDLEAQMREGTGELFPGWSSGISPQVEGRVRSVSKDERAGQDAQESKAGAEAGSTSNNESTEKGQTDGDGESSKRTPGSIVKKAKTVVVDGLNKLKK